jgi:7,8-dihydropterin-6-yl-methyl-4-(beta-D-ribofuranosyl)aminobenzene 5'-phosphate synthase
MMKKCVLVLLSLVFLTGTAFGSTMGKLKIAILCNDTPASSQYMAEHGVSIFVGLPNGHHWLFDTGTTDVYQLNAKKMGLSLDNLKGIIISHGHDDHTGGLAFYPRLKGDPPIYGHPYIWAKQYQVKKGAPVRICGMPYMARKYAAPHFHAVHGITKMDQDLYFFTDVPRPAGSYAPTKGKFFNEDGTGPCPITDDGTLVVKTPKGLVVLFGCGHAGYVNILQDIHQKFPKEKLLAVIGGLHLKSANDKVLAKAAAYTETLKGKGFTFYGGHCTGKNAIAFFKTKFGDKAVQPMGAGRVLEF